MKLKRGKPKLRQVMTKCSWCGVKIKDEGPIYALGCKKRPEVDISKYESKVMPIKISTSGKTIWSIVPPADSDARGEGNDMMFTLCSEDCGDQLKGALDIEIKIGKLILSAEHIY